MLTFIKWAMVFMAVSVMLSICQGGVSVRDSLQDLNEINREVQDTRNRFLNGQ